MQQGIEFRRLCTGVIKAETVEISRTDESAVKGIQKAMKID